MKKTTWIAIMGTIVLTVCTAAFSLSATAADGITINENSFPDANFRTYVSTNFDTDGNGSLSQAELDAVTRIAISLKRIEDLTGIQYFGNLKELYAQQNKLSSINLDANTKLENLNISHNTKLGGVDLGTLTQLKWLSCANIGASVLDVSSNTALTYLDCNANRLTYLDVSNNTALSELYIDDNPILSIDVTANTALSRFGFAGTYLTSLDLSSQGSVILRTELPRYTITPNGNTFNLSALSSNFDPEKTSNWVNAERLGNIITIVAGVTEVTYDYDCGNGQKVTFSLVTDTPVPDGPTTEPPVTEPPVTEPPVTEPPVTEPPVTEPPVTEPPVTEPPVTEPDTPPTPSTPTNPDTPTPPMQEPDEEPWVNPYSDIPNDHPNMDAIEHVTKKNVFQGTDKNNPTFSPDMKLTRAQFVTILGRLAGVDVTKYTTSSFKDVDPTKSSHKWFAPYVEWASEQGIVLGYGDGRFGPTDELTIEQALAFLARYARLDGKSTDSNASLDAYDDANAVSKWALADMKWAVANGIYTGEEGNLTPKEITDRLLTAIFIYLYDTTL